MQKPSVYRPKAFSQPVEDPCFSQWQKLEASFILLLIQPLRTPCPQLLDPEITQSRRKTSENRALALILSHALYELVDSFASVTGFTA